MGGRGDVTRAVRRISCTTRPSQTPNTLPESMGVPSDSGLITGTMGGSTITIIFIVCMVICYYLFPMTRGSTSNLVMWRSLADLIMACNLILAEINLGHDHPVTKEECLPYSMVHQFSIMASGCWFMTMSAELWRAVQWPFTKHPNHPIRNHCLVWGTSALTTFTLWISDKYGVSSLQICWIETSHNLFNAWLWALFYIPTVGFYILSIMILIHVSKKWTGVSQRSHVTRRKVLKEGTAYTVGFCVYWTVLGILYSSLILSNQQFEPNRSRTRAIV